MMSFLLLPVAVLLFVGVLAQPQLSVSAWGTCAVWGEELKCWGSPAYMDASYVEGDSTTAITLPPADSFNLGDDFSPSQVISGVNLNCAVSVDGAARCWGDSDFGIGYGNTLYFSDVANFGQDIEFATGFIIESGECGYIHYCFLSLDQMVQCFGHNAYGQLGYGDTAARSDEAGEMGDDLPFVDLGDFVPMQIAAGSQFTCALSINHTVKCFGVNNYGQLGYGDQTYRGDDANEMGQYLGEVGLGNNFKPVHIVCGGYHSCALSDEGKLKCWGSNGYGQLGYEDNNGRGSNVNQMGDYLDVVDLGSGFIVNDMFLGGFHVCVSSTEGRVKCFGDSRNGQLGNGNTDTIGRAANDMGDYLDFVDLGTGFNFSHFAVGGGGFAWSTCAVSTENDVRCWGGNGNGNLGIGDKDKRGDTASEMGDFLPLVNLSMGAEVPTNEPTAVPTSEPTAGISYEFVKRSCFGPAPYGNSVGDYGTYNGQPKTLDECIALCEGIAECKSFAFSESGLKCHLKDMAQTEGDECADATSWNFQQWYRVTVYSCTDRNETNVVNWHKLLNDAESSTTSLLKNYSVDFDQSTLSLTFGAMVQYVGESADGNFDDDFNLGTTYWIDFKSFSNVDGVESAGSCTNRRAADYDDLTFDEVWSYTVNPADLQSVNTSERMAYPPSDWALTAKNCSVVEYERTLSWTEMTACVDDAGNGVIDVTETTHAVTLSGTFFVELVSPYSMESEGYYRSFPLIQQDFAIVLDRQVDAFASTGVQLFISTVMAYGRDDDENYELTILVQSADYVLLDDVTLISGPWGTSDIRTVTGDGCLVASSFTCGQIFTATIPADCSTDDNTVDLSGTYQFAFEPDCRTREDGSEDPACTTFLTTLDDSAGKVVLDVDASFTDNCDVDLFSVTFDANLTFYEDDAFTVAVNDDDAFVIGQDTIYGKVLVDIPLDEDGEMYDFVQVSIENVYVCTAVDTADLSLDASSGLGGCLSEHIDADGPYVVYGSGAETKYQGTTYDATGNEATFSFLTFDTPRTTINVHVQLLLTLETETGGRRRMLLEVEGDQGNAFRSFVGTASVQEGETTADPVGTDGVAQVSVGFIVAMVAVTAYVLG